MNFKKKIPIIFLFVIVFIIWNDFKKIDVHYVNQSWITYDTSNLNNNILKKIYKLYDKTIEYFLINNYVEHKDYWKKEKRKSNENLSDIITIAPKNKFTLNINQNEINESDWPRSHGNNHSNRFSNLDQINNQNAHNLEIAWKYESLGEKLDIQANPVIVNGIIYTPIAGGSIVAIEGSSGKLIWKSEKIGSFAARRGLIYWSGNSIEEARIIFSNRERLISLYAKNGKYVKSFGNNGKVRSGLNVTAPIIYKNNIVIATWDKSVEVYDLINGKIKWKIKYKKDISKRIGGVNHNNAGSHPWGGISADIKRGILYFTTGNPHSYFDGTRRPGDNRYSNSLIAVDLEQKKILWDFQETSHDIWNSDLAAPPILTSIKRGNKKIDVVVTPTKRANTLVLDRVTGENVFEFRLRKAPPSVLEGEKTTIYQPDLTIPQPFGKNIFSINDLWSYDPIKLKKHIQKYINYNFGFYQTYELNKKNIQYNFNGGAEWMGSSIDHENQIMYVTSNNIPWEAEIIKTNSIKESVPKYVSSFKRALDDNGYPVTKPPWGTITSLNLNTGKIIWQIPFGEFEYLKKKGIPRTGTENFGGVTATAGKIVIGTGTLDKKIYIFDSENGNILYSKELPFIGSAPPSTFMINKIQYIIVHASGGLTLKQGYPSLVKTGNMLIAFKLKNK